ncbi:hypothetical protein CC80DRAFT_595116 [Byssothecium circinans]|uniref:F-box domain-containing protein n=1 Tax=Byssothecium circinans TaxID=147558 RepID=A0A6A5TPH7_9PLEO|nr:hypothetical protein CC80DRAFT_595116 [Byssothecium circinans]
MYTLRQRHFALQSRDNASRQPGREHFSTIPDELLLMITEPLTDRSDLCALARTARRFTALIQELLFTSAVLREGPQQKSYVMQFACVLFARPDLARAVRSLQLAVAGRFFRSEFGKLKARAVWFGEQFWKECALGNGRDDWVEPLYEGYEPAFAGIILMLLPNLESLSFVDHAGYCGPEISPATLFGLSDDEYYYLLVPGLQNLKHLYVEGNVPHDLVDIAWLESFEIGIRPMNNSRLARRTWWTPLEHLTSLNVHCDIHRVNSHEDLDRFAFGIAKALPALRHLTVHLKDSTQGTLRESFGGRSIFDFNTYSAPFHNSFSGVNGVIALESLIIETSQLNFRNLLLRYWFDNFKPLPHLTWLSRLRHLRIPQGAIMDHELDPYPWTGRLIILSQRRSGQAYFPGTLEVVEVTNIKWNTLTDWAEQLLDWKADGGLRRLKKVVLRGDVPAPSEDKWLWYKHSPDSPREGSPWSRLRQVGVEVEQSLDGCEILES